MPYLSMEFTSSFEKFYNNYIYTKEWVFPLKISGTKVYITLDTLCIIAWYLIIIMIEYANENNVYIYVCNVFSMMCLTYLYNTLSFNKYRLYLHANARSAHTQGKGYDRRRPRATKKPAAHFSSPFAEYEPSSTFGAKAVVWVIYMYTYICI